MKISQFCIAGTGFMYAAANGNLPAVSLFGILALLEHCKIMSALEGGEDQWESHGR